MRLRVRAAGATTRVEADTLGQLKAALLRHPSDASFWVSLNGQDPLTGTDDTPLSALGVRAGDLVYSATTAPAVEATLPPRPPPKTSAGLTAGAAAHLLAASTGVPSSLRAALEGVAPSSIPTAIASAAHAAVVDAGFRPAWSEGFGGGGGGGAGCSAAARLPPGWAPALTAPPLRYTYGPPAPSSPALEVRAYDCGAFTVVAGGLVGGGGGGGGVGGAGSPARVVSVRTADHAPGGGGGALPLARIPDLVIALADGLASPLARAAAAAAAAAAEPTPQPRLPLPPRALPDLPPDLLFAIAALLPGRDLAALSCTCRGLGAAAADDGLWTAALAREFGPGAAPHSRTPLAGCVAAVRGSAAGPREAFAARWAERRRATAAAGRARLLAGRVGAGYRPVFPHWTGPAPAWAPRGGPFGRGFVGGGGAPGFIGGPFGRGGGGGGGGGPRWRPPS